VRAETRGYERLSVKVRKFVLRLGTGLEVSRRLDFVHMLVDSGCSTAQSTRLDAIFIPVRFG